MLQKVWTGDNRRITVCIDSYEGEVLRGWFCNANREVERFESLVQFLVAVESVLEEQQSPQAYTAVRTFSEHIPSTEGTVSIGYVPKGMLATFELQILFRQHTSWQGVLIWREEKQEQSFRSVLELVILMDSALRMRKDGVAS